MKIAHTRWAQRHAPKKANIAAGAHDAAMAGNTNVSAAQNDQCVKLPKLCPSARKRCGNISDMKTHITTPCPTAKNTMNWNMHIAASTPRSKTNAEEAAKWATMQPMEPIIKSVRRPSRSMRKSPAKVPRPRTTVHGNLYYYCYLLLLCRNIYHLSD